MTIPTQSAVIVAMHEAEALVAAHRGTLDPSAALGVPAHLTVLYPFAAPDSLGTELVGRLRSAVGQVPRFTTALSRTGWFGEQVLYLAPDDPRPFLALTDAVVRAFPEHPPYGGRFPDVVPHLTVGEGAPLDALRAAERAVLTGLPIVAAVSEVLLMVGSEHSGSWRVHTRVALAAAPAR